MNGAIKLDDDLANAGLRHKPGLKRHKDIAPKWMKPSTNEFDPDADEQERDVVASRALARDIRFTARGIGLDLGDDMELEVMSQQPNQRNCG